MTKTQIKNMTVAERLQTMEALWDSLLLEESEMKSPEWHKDVISERRKLIKHKQTEFITLDELKNNHKS